MAVLYNDQHLYLPEEDCNRDMYDNYFLYEIRILKLENM